MKNGINRTFKKGMLIVLLLAADIPAYKFEDIKDCILHGECKREES